MPEVPQPAGRPPVGRLFLLALIVLTGLGLFFVLERSAPTVVEPAVAEDSR